MDGAHEGHARIGQFANELHDVVRGLSIKTRCRFCNTSQQKDLRKRKEKRREERRGEERRGEERRGEERGEEHTIKEKNLRLAHKLHADSKTFPLLHRDTQTTLHVTNQGITEMCHLHHLQHLLDVFVLLCQWDGGVLSHACRETKCLAHGNAWISHIFGLD